MNNEEERKQYPWELWFLFWIGIAIIAVTLGLIGLYYLRWPMLEWLRDRIFTGHLDSHYLLSATAQVLGALFALVFSITLIAVQFVTKYTHETMKIIFNWRLIFYMGGFASSVILPLWWLLNPTELGTYISIVTGSLVVLSLILLFLDLKKRMNIKWALDYLKKRALKEVEKEPDFEREVNKPAEEKVTAIDNIAMGAYGDHNYEVFRLAEMALGSFTWELEEKCGKLEEKSTQKALHAFVSRMLRDTCKETIDNPRAPIITISHVGKVGAKAIERGLLKTENAARNTIVNIAKLCDRDTRIRLSIQCFTSLYWMLKALKDTGKDKSAQEHLIGKLLFIYNIHLDKGWTDWLHFLSESVIEFIPEFQLFDSLEICQKIFKRVWTTAARLESKESLQRLGSYLSYLRDTEVIEHLIADDKPFQDAIAKGKTLGIKKEIFCQRWEFLSKFSRAKTPPPQPCP